MTDSSKNSNLPLRRFRNALASPRAEKRVDALLSAPNPEEAVQALGVTDLYLLVNEVGLVDSVELLSLCTTEQVQGCVDMEIWERDLPQIEAFLPWLAALRDNGFEKFGAMWSGMDQELTALTLARLCRIYDRSLGEEAPEDEERPLFQTPDTFFDIVITAEQEHEVKLVHAIIEDLYRYDMVAARHSIMAARSEPAAELEEMSYRWRSGRMADLGYVDFHDALEVFRPIDPHSVQIGEGSARDARAAVPIEDSGDLPVPVLEPLVGQSFLGQALDGIEDEAEIQRLQEALLFLVNRVMSAARVSPGDAESLRVASQHAMATLALGLEHVSNGELPQAIEALHSISLTRLHRLGYSLCLRLSRFARMVASRAVLAGEPSLTVLDAVLAKRPFFPEVLDTPGSSELRPIESKADLVKIAHHLQELALRIAIATGLGVDLGALAELPEPRPELDDYVRTALLRACLGGEAHPAPLSSEELQRFRSEAFDEDGLNADHKRSAYEELERALDAAEVVEARALLPGLADTWLSELDQSFKGIPKGQAPDPRYLGGLILAGSMA